MDRVNPESETLCLLALASAQRDSHGSDMREFPLVVAHAAVSAKITIVVSPLRPLQQNLGLRL